MAEFVWEARARTGELRKGVMEADDEVGVQNRLRGQQLMPTKIKKNAKVRVHYIKEGNDQLVDKVIVFGSY